MPKLTIVIIAFCACCTGLWLLSVLIAGGYLYFKSDHHQKDKENLAAFSSYYNQELDSEIASGKSIIPLSDIVEGTVFDVICVPTTTHKFMDSVATSLSKCRNLQSLGTQIAESNIHSYFTSSRKYRSFYKTLFLINTQRRHIFILELNQNISDHINDAKDNPYFEVMSNDKTTLILHY